MSYLDGLIWDLGSSDARVRERAIVALTRIGDKAVPLLKAVERRAGFMKKGAERALNKIKQAAANKAAEPAKKPGASSTIAETGSYVTINYCIALQGAFPSRN